MGFGMLVVLGGMYLFEYCTVERTVRACRTPLLLFWLCLPWVEL